MLGGDLRLNLGASSDLLAVTGAATFTSASTVTPTFSAPPALGPVTLLTTSALTLTTAPSLALPANTRSTFALTNTATALQLSITGAAAQTLAWSGTASGAWDINTTFNFNAGAEKFFTFDGVTFGDGPANRTVTLAAGLTPSNVAVNNSAGNDYTFQTGTLNGSMALTKAGSGALNLNTANAFDGAVTVTGGTLKAGNAAALGSISGQTFVSGGGTLDINGQNLGAERFNIAGTGVGGNGALINTGAVQAQATRFITLTADATIGGTAAGRFDIRTNGGGEVLDLAGFTLTKTGGNQFSIVGVPVVTNGNIVVNQGLLSIETTTVIQGAGTITFNAGTTAQYYQTVATSVTRPMVWNGNSVETGAQNSGLGSNVTLGGDTTFINTGNTLTLTGNVAETGGARALIKNNGGAVALQGNVSYTGATTVNGGTLTIGNGLATTLPATSAITLTGGGTLTFSAIGNMTLAPVTIAASGGTLRWSGGDQSSTLTINSALGSSVNFGTFSANSGTTTLASGANLNLNFVQIGSANTLSSGNVGTLNIQPGATVLTQFMRSGDGGTASGFINQTGGNVTVTGIDVADANADGPLRIGHFSGQGAYYNISGGSLSVPNGSLDIGTDGNETALNISGSAQVSTKHLEIDGRNASTPIGGIVRMSGGTLSTGDGGIGRGNGGATNTLFNFSAGTLRATAVQSWLPGISFDSAAPIVDTNSFDVFMAGAVEGPGGFAKNGAGTLTLASTANNLRGTLDINGGTVAVAGNLTGPLIVNANSGGTLLTLAANAVGNAASTINVNSGGTVLALGSTAGGGAVNVNTGGTLFSPASLGNLAVASGGNVRPGAGDGTVGTLTANSFIVGGGNFRFDLNGASTTTGAGVNDLVAATTTAFFVGGTVTPAFSGLPVSGNVYTLFTSAGLTGLPAVDPAAGGASTRLTYGLAASGNNVQLTVTGTAKTLTWTGATNANWNVNTTQNWLDTSPAPDNFFQVDAVNFDDSVAVTNVALVGSLQPSTITVNAVQNYTFSGSGSIDSGTLTKSNTGRLTLLTNNAFAATTINGGTVQVGNGGTTGALGSGNVADNGALVFNRSDNQGLLGIISGTGSVTFAGGATYTLFGNAATSTYSGGTTVSAGTATTSFSNAGGAVPVSGPFGTGAITLGDANTGAGNVALLLGAGADIGNAVTVSALGSGTATLGAANNNGGTVNATSFLGTVTLSRATTFLAPNNIDRLTFDGKITGAAGTITVTGGGRTTLVNTANDFTGDIVVSGSGTTLQASVASAGEVIPNTASVTVGTGTFFQLAGTAASTETMNALISPGGALVTRSVAGLQTLALGSAGGTGSFSGVIQNGSGQVALTKLGAGTQTLLGTVSANGPVTVNAGTLSIGASLPTATTLAPLVFTLNGGVLEVSSTNAFAGAAGVASRPANTNTTVVSATGAAVPLTVATTVNLAVGMSVTGTNVPAGSRIATIPSGTTFTLTTSIVTAVANATALAFGAPPVNFNGGTLRYTAGAATDDRLVSLNTTGGTLDASGTGALTLSAAALQFPGTGARTLTLAGTSTAANTLAAVITDNTGATALAKTGPGTWVLTGVAGTYTGGVSITDGVLRLGTNLKALGDGFAVSVSGTGTLDVNAANGATATRRYDITASGFGVAGQAAIWNSSATGIVNNPIYRSLTLAGDTSIGGVGRYDINGGTVDGAGTTFNGGTFTLTKVGANDLWWAPNGGATVGTIIVNGGVFGVQSSLNLGSNAFPILVNSAGTLYTFSAVTNDKPILLNSGILGANNATGTWTGSVTLNGPGTTNRIAPLTGTQVTLSGVVGGDGFEKQQPGTLELQNAGNNWVGDTRITAGTVRTTVAGALSPSTTLDMNGGTLDLFSTAQTAAGLKGATGTITGNGALNIVQAATTTYGGTISSSTAFTKDGAGKLSLTGVNTHTGGTSVIGGILNINADAALGATGNAVTISNAATLQAGGPVTSARAFTLGTGGGKIDTAGQTVTLNASSSLAGTSLEKAGAGVLNISSTQTYAALTTSGGTTNIYTPLGTGTSTVAANAAVSFYASQTLASLTIADGVEVNFGDGLPLASVPEKGGAFSGVATVPEPGSLALLLSASLSLLARRRRRPQSLPL